MRRMVALLGLVALVGSACADRGEEGTELEEGGPAAGEASYGAEGTAAAPGASAGLSVQALPDGMEYLTDGGGRSLYVLEGEPQGQSTCYDGCAEVWPPFLASQGSPSGAGGSLRQDLLGTLQRRDGATQVSYGGRALYYFNEDAGPGDVRGQDRTDAWGEWYLVQPSGETVPEHPSDGRPPAP